MAETETVHILDQEVRRRAVIARTLMGIGYHAELYDGLDELVLRPPRSGVVMVYEDAHPPLPCVLEAISQTGSYLPVAMYSSEVEPQRIVAAMLSGALDYLIWPIPPDTLRRSLERMGSYSSSIEARRRREADARRQVEGLSAREKQVLRAVVEGASSKQIGRDLGISPRTVEIHRANVMRKLAATSVSDVVRIGLYAGVDSAPE